VRDGDDSMCKYDVFLSHNSREKPAVEVLAHRLIDEAGLQPFLDKWHLVPGEPWQEAIEEALEQSDTVAVFVGPSGTSPWHNEEMRAALDNAVRTRDEYRVIPVLLPGATEASVARFLARRTWVDFRSGLDDVEAFQRLVAGIKGEATVSGTYELPDEPAPYRGLLHFEAEQAAFFFGREADTQQLIEKLGKHTFVAVIGASGSGKSSLVRAGLLPALADDALPTSHKWYTLVFTPGGQPLRVLAEQLATLVPPADRLKTADELTERLANRIDGLRTAATTLLARSPSPGSGGGWGRGDQPLFLVIDQFEEIFTLYQDGPERCRAQAEQFIANLVDAVQRGDHRIRVLITLRADFLDRCLAFPQLKNLLQDRQMLLGPLDEPALRDAIVRPAQVVGAFFEKGLVSTILRDLQAQPGALPLLQHALYELWRARRGPWLTLDAYETSGGVSGALQRRAQVTYDALTPEQQALARSIFLRLTALGEGMSDTRRRVSRAELYPAGVDPAQVDAVLQALSGPQARLVVADEQTVEVTHEALIQQWDKLRNWLEADRASLRTHRRLTEAASEWNRNDYDESYLYHGARLAEAEEWAEAHADDMNPMENEFLEASVEAREAERIAGRQRVQRVIAGLVIGLIVISAVAVFAWGRSQLAEQRRVDAENAKTAAQAESTRAINAEGTAQAEATRAIAAEGTAVAEATIARSREIAAVAATQLEVDAERSLLLAIEAIQEAYTVQAEDILRRSLIESRVRVRLPGHTGYYQGLAWSTDGTQLAIISANSRVQLWDTIQLRPTTTLHSDYGRMSSIAWSPNGVYLAAASQEGVVWLWNIQTSEVLDTIAGYEESVNDLTWSPDSQRLAAGGCAMEQEQGHKCLEGGILIWDVLQNIEPIQLGGLECEDNIFGCAVEDLAWSPHGEHLAAGLGDGTLRLWETATGNRTAVLNMDSIIYSVAWSPNGQQLASLGLNGVVRVWNIKTENIDRTMFAHTSHVSNKAVRIAWNPDGEWLAFNGQDYKVRLWNLDTGQVVLLTGHTDDIKGLAWSPDGQQLASASLDGSVRLWDVDFGHSLTVLSKGLGYPVDTVTWSPQGTQLAFSYYGLELWNVDTEEWTTIPGTRSPRAIAWDPSGTQLAFASRDDIIHVWDVVDSRELFSLEGHSDSVLDIAWNPDGTLLASVSGDHTMRIWDTTSGKEVKTVHGSEEHGNAPGSVAWSSDGMFLAFSLQEPIMWIWSLGEDEGIPMDIPEDEIVHDLAWSPDDTKIASASGEVHVWDVATGEKLFSLATPYSRPLEGAYSVAWSPDGNQLACGYHDGIIHLWDISAKKSIMSLAGHTEKVLSLAWSPDGKRLASGSQDFSARIYYTDIQDLIDIARQQISWRIFPNGDREQRQLTPEERYLYLGESLLP
jgi:WD40 repeat protein/energy-coupling factor transporter ATP-binding protein EcfA2